MNTRHKIASILDHKEHLRPFLFARGFLMTDLEQNTSGYPFYNEWNHYTIDRYHFYVHSLQKLHHAKFGDVTCFLIGHAFNPFTKEISEKSLLQAMAYSNQRDRIALLNQLTGVFTAGWIEHNQLTLVSDCAGMQVAYYGIIDGHIYVSTHMQLIGDLCDLEVSEYVQRLINYRFYKFYGAYLPGDLSSYDKIKRLVPNTLVKYSNFNFEIKRFYPSTQLTIKNTPEEYQNGISSICEIMHNTLELISQKWNYPAISLTGGMDSKGTLAAANGFYDKFQYFSYVSIPGEKIDADAAHSIAQFIGIPHRIDVISDNDMDFDDIDDCALLLEHNSGNIGKSNKNDIRKRVFYSQKNTCSFDIEVKSWVSEIGRANYYKKFGLKKMPSKLTPRQMTSMYKLFIHDRFLVKQTDSVFGDYINKTEFEHILNFDPSDMFLWEMRYGGWGGPVITCEHKFSFDITVPYNNRLLMELFLSLPLETRISDQAHCDLIRSLNPKIDETGITVTNYNETKIRMYLEKLYFITNSILAP